MSISRGKERIITRTFLAENFPADLLPNLKTQSESNSLRGFLADAQRDKLNQIFDEARAEENLRQKGFSQAHIASIKKFYDQSSVYELFLECCKALGLDDTNRPVSLSNVTKKVSLNDDSIIFENEMKIEGFLNPEFLSDPVSNPNPKINVTGWFVKQRIILNSEGFHIAELTLTAGEGFISDLESALHPKKMKELLGEQEQYMGQVPGLSTEKTEYHNVTENINSADTKKKIDQFNVLQIIKNDWHIYVKDEMKRIIRIAKEFQIEDLTSDIEKVIQEGNIQKKFDAINTFFNHPAVQTTMNYSAARLNTIQKKLNVVQNFFKTFDNQNLTMGAKIDEYQNKLANKKLIGELNKSNDRFSLTVIKTIGTIFSLLGVVTIPLIFKIWSVKSEKVTKASKTQIKNNRYSSIFKQSTKRLEPEVRKVAGFFQKM